MSRLGAAVILLVALGVSGCSDGDRDTTLTVGAAASLTEPVTAFITDYEERHPGARVQVEFAGSDTLAARIRQGVGIDVYLTADAALSAALADEGQVARPRPVGRNRLVVAVRADRLITEFDDLVKPGVKLAIGGPNVPIGAYAREALSAKGDAYAIRVMENVATNELDVRGVIGKVELGVVDGGIVYRTDVPTFKTELTVLPFDLDDTPPIIYTAAVVDGAAPRDDAERFVTELAGPLGRTILNDAGFAAP